ncbi:MAG: hypothetical protein QXZ44_00930 [Ferroplasma sp.]
MNFKGLNASWFPVVLGTLSISLAFFIDYLVFGFAVLFNIGKIVFYIAFSFFIIVFASWIYRYIRNPILVKQDYNDITMLSFTAFLGVLFYAFSFFYIVYVGIGSFTAHILFYLFILFYAAVLLINVLLNYNLYTNRYSFDKISYANLVPTVVMASGIILSSTLLTPPVSSYFTLGMLQAMYFMAMAAFGMSFFQFLFIGISAYISHINGRANYLQSVPAAMIPVGASSMLIINLLFMPQFNYIGLFYVGISEAVDASMMFWGFDVFLFLVSGFIALAHMRKQQSMTVWAYVFPIGISIFADYMLYASTKLAIFSMTIILFNIILIVFYIYAWINTFRLSTYKSIKK